MTKRKLKPGKEFRYVTRRRGKVTTRISHPKNARRWKSTRSWDPKKKAWTRNVRSKVSLRAEGYSTNRKNERAKTLISDQITVEFDHPSWWTKDEIQAEAIRVSVKEMIKDAETSENVRVYKGVKNALELSRDGTTDTLKLGSSGIEDVKYKKGGKTYVDWDWNWKKE